MERFPQLNKYIQRIIIGYAAQDIRNVFVLRLTSKQCKHIADVRLLPLVVQADVFVFLSKLNSTFHKCVPFESVVKHGVTGVILWSQVCAFFYIRSAAIARELKDIQDKLGYNLDRLKRKRNTLKIDIDNGIYGRNKRSKKTTETPEEWSYRMLDVYEKRIRDVKTLSTNGRKEHLELQIATGLENRNRLHKLIFDEVSLQRYN